MVNLRLNGLHALVDVGADIGLAFLVPSTSCAHPLLSQDEVRLNRSKSFGQSVSPRTGCWGLHVLRGVRTTERSLLVHVLSIDRCDGLLTSCSRTSTVEIVSLCTVPFKLETDILLDSIELRDLQIVLIPDQFVVVLEKKLEWEVWREQS